MHLPHVNRIPNVFERVRVRGVKVRFRLAGVCELRRGVTRGPGICIVPQWRFRVRVRVLG